jgi:hypothetical protein
MLVRMCVSRGPHKPGDVIELDEAEAVILIKSGRATPERERRKEHAVTYPKAERAVR